MMLVGVERVVSETEDVVAASALFSLISLVVDSVALL